MTCAKKALMVVVLTSLLGLWGCTQNSSSGSASVRLRELEARTARLEDDYKTAITARDLARKKANSLEEQRVQLAQQVELLQRAAKERDELRTQMNVRTAERDNLQANLLQFSRDLQNLAVKIDQAAQSNGANPAPVSAAPQAAKPPSTPAS
jgi:uncharacterized coiled-coil DUF342 family protein